MNNHAKRLAVMMALVSITSAAQHVDTQVDLSRDARNLADWIIQSVDNQDLPFIIIDKREAKVFVFLPQGGLFAASAVLIGTTIGDHTTPGVGQKKLSEITIKERTTPAGRYEAGLGSSPDKSELVWVDYESGLSIHPVVTNSPSERRLERLASLKMAERRITYGCINVSSLFYKEAIHPTFEKSSGIVYILPEVHSIKMVFGAQAGLFSQRK